MINDNAKKNKNKTKLVRVTVGVCFPVTLNASQYRE